MKKVLTAAIATASFVVLAQNVTLPSPSYTKPGVNHNRSLTPPGFRTNSNFRVTFPEVTGPHVLLVSASDKVGTNVLESAKGRIMMMLRLPVKTDIRSFDGCALEYGEKVLKETNVAAVVIVKDDPNAPPMVSMPEKRIVVINPLSYCPEGTAKEVVDARMNKILQRGYSAVMGAALAPIFSAEDLDAVNGGIAPSAIGSVFYYGKTLGMGRMTPIALDKDGNPIKRLAQASATNAPSATPPAK